MNPDARGQFEWANTLSADPLGFDDRSVAGTVDEVAECFAAMHKLQADLARLLRPAVDAERGI
jgi:hypothetical protein